MILGLGVPEMLVILVVVLIIFGPKNLPKLGSALGKTVKEVREGMEEEDDKPEAASAAQASASAAAGSKHAPAQDSATAFCPHCGARVSADSAFCPHCGAQLPHAENAVAAEAADEPVEAATEPADGAAGQAGSEQPAAVAADAQE